MTIIMREKIVWAMSSSACMGILKGGHCMFLYYAALVKVGVLSYSFKALKQRQICLCV